MQLRGNRTFFLSLIAIALLFQVRANAVNAPDWMRHAAKQALPSYKAETDAVILLDEQTTTVKDNGDVTTLYRRVYKILRPNGRKFGDVLVYFDDETKLTYLKAWSISPKGEEFEVKEKDAIETSILTGSLYQDTRHKLLQIPAPEPGAVIGYEYEQRRRPSILQDSWAFQEEIPVRTTRFSLRLPAGWEFETYWANHDAVQPKPTADGLTWELADVPAIEEERDMPSWRAVAGRLVLNYFPIKADMKEKTHASWSQVGTWYWQLASARRQTTPQIKQRVTELTTSVTNPLDKIRALAAFVQRDIRYVAIEIGIGGYQPHLAGDIFTNRYGDCKDKATLLSTMLREIGIESYYVLVHVDRGVVRPEIPSALTFNHVILALKLPDSVDSSHLLAVSHNARLGNLLYFDPTSEMTPVGELPASLQENYGLLVTENAGELQKLPLLPPQSNRLMRSAKLELSPEGTLSGSVEEVRTGQYGAAARGRLLQTQNADRAKILEEFLGDFLGSFHLTKASVGNLEVYGEPLVLRYSFIAPNYAKTAGNLFLVRPRVMGEKGDDVLETEKERKFPVEFSHASLQSDRFEITLPAGYSVDELPDPLEIRKDFADYTSKAVANASTLSYSRDLLRKQVTVPLSQVPDLKAFYRDIGREERSSAVFMKAAN